MVEHEDPRGPHNPNVASALPESARWSARLKEIASQPLAYCRDFPLIAARFEAWWHQALRDRPLFIAEANTNPARPLARRLELLHDPDAWFDAKRRDLEQTHRVGDALPSIRVDFGPVMLGGLLGAQTEFGADTTWTHPFIDDDWSNAPSWTIAPDNRWWQWLQELARRVAIDGRGRYLLRTPDLGGSADVLMNLRSPDALCLDVVDQPQVFIDALEAIYPCWRRAFMRLYQLGLEQGTGVIHWLGVWSDQPYVIPACDFNYLVGPREFQRICLPDIARQTAEVGRAVFHLDGPGAARHIDALLEVPHLQAIQFTPGEGARSALAWVEMFRKIQSKGRSLLVLCPHEEVLALTEALKPEGLAIMLTSAPSPSRLDELFTAFCRRY